MASIVRYIPFFFRPSRLGPSRSLLLGLTLGFSLSLSFTGLALWSLNAFKRRLTKDAMERIVDIRENEVLEGVEGLIGNTPLIRINSLSDLLGVEILGKCEFLNPFGSVKDRVSLRIIKQAEEEGLIHPHTGSCIFEGTSGSTGISIAGIARARGYKAHIVVPDDIAAEKIQLLEALGAIVERVRPVSIVDKKHYVNLARLRALEFGKTQILSTDTPSPSDSFPTSSLPRDSTTDPSLLVTSQSNPPNTFPQEEKTKPLKDLPRGLFADQFENLSNLAAHYETTGPEIWRQTSGVIDGFVSGSGTGGTIAGVGRYLKEVGGEDVQIVLGDPEGSGLFHKVQDGVMYASTEAEGKRRRYQTDTIVEGIGLNRLTKNFSEGLPFIDDAFRVTDAEAVAMSRHLAIADGLFLGSSAAVNLVTCVRLAKKWGKGSGKTIVTILCDSGTRHYSRFWNDDYLESVGIPVSSSIESILEEEVVLN